MWRWLVCGVPGAGNKTGRLAEKRGGGWLVGDWRQEVWEYWEFKEYYFRVVRYAVYPFADNKTEPLAEKTTLLAMGSLYSASSLRSRAVRALCAAPPITSASKIVRSTRRDDRGMMAQCCAGRGELMFPSFPAHCKPAPASARRLSLQNNGCHSREVVAG